MSPSSSLSFFHFQRILFLGVTLFGVGVFIPGLFGIGENTVWDGIGLGAFVATTILLWTRWITPSYLFLLITIANAMLVVEHAIDGSWWLTILPGIGICLCGPLTWLMRKEPSERELLRRDAERAARPPKPKTCWVEEELLTRGVGQASCLTGDPNGH